MDFAYAAKNVYALRTQQPETMTLSWLINHTTKSERGS